MQICVSATGLVTSVGRDTATSCASIRAGISRPSQLKHFAVVEHETHEAVPLIGHPIQGFTEGFNIVGLWTRLAKHVLKEAFANANMEATDPAFPQGTAVIAVLPYINDDRFQSEGDENEDLIVDAFLTPLFKDLGIAMSRSQLFAVCVSNSGTAAALLKSSELIRANAFSRTVVLAVDSYLDSLSLQWLSTNDRLKSDDNPTGLTPGEAGVCLVVEKESSAHARGVSPLVRVRGATLDQEEKRISEGSHSDGVGLAKSAQRLLQEIEAFDGGLIADHNGENWRARELSGFRIRMRDSIPLQAELTLPALSVGDVGAASGALGVCVFAHAHQRGYARSKESLVVSSTERGDVGAIHIQSPN